MNPFSNRDYLRRIPGVCKFFLNLSLKFALWSYNNVKVLISNIIAYEIIRKYSV